MASSPIGDRKPEADRRDELRIGLRLAVEREQRPPPSEAGLLIARRESDGPAQVPLRLLGPPRAQEAGAEVPVRPGIAAVPFRGPAEGDDGLGEPL